MKWLHCEEDDRDYNVHTLHGVDKQAFINEFVSFLHCQKDYLIFVATEDNVLTSAMFVHIIPKVPKPNSHVRSIAYLTNVFTKQEYRGKAIGTQLLAYIKSYLKAEHCELIFAWPSEKSVPFYTRNEFQEENDIVEYIIIED